MKLKMSLCPLIRHGAMLLALSLPFQGAAAQTMAPAGTAKTAPAASAATTTTTAAPAKPATPEEQIKMLAASVEDLSTKNKTFLDALARCAAIPERVMRIQCYDVLAVESGFMTRAKQQEEEKFLQQIGFWQIVVSQDKMGEQTLYLKLLSNDVVQTGAATEKSPELVLRCYRKNTEVYLDWKGLLGENKNYVKSLYVSSRFDSENPMQKDWQLSLDKFAAYAPDPIAFVRQMKNHKVLILEFTPYKSSATTLAFTLDGFDKALDVLVKRCYN